jgi:hypothetical protein
MLDPQFTLAPAPDLIRLQQKVANIALVETLGKQPTFQSKARDGPLWPPRSLAVGRRQFHFISTDKRDGTPDSAQPDHCITLAPCRRSASVPAPARGSQSLSLARASEETLPLPSRWCRIRHRHPHYSP